MKRRTLDFDAAMQRLQFYAVEKLGDHQSLTPEGFLAITDVPLCRTGILIYGPNEVPIKTGADGTVRVYREPEDVFSPTHIASIQGKSVVNDHPPDDVTPSNWKSYHVGTVLNPRRGEGALSDLLIGDMLIMDPQAIKDIQSGKREVSMGYDADYEEDAPGIGRQRNLIANHVALVEAGRCGPRCAIKDAHPSTLEGDDMKTRDNAGAAKRRVKLSDEAIEQIGEILGTAAANDNESGEHTHIHVHAAGGEGNPDTRTIDDESLQAFMEQNATEHAGFEQRIAALEAKAGAGGGTGDGESEEEKAAREAKEKAAQDAKDASEAEKATEEELAEEAPPATKDKARKAKDSVYLGDSFQDTIAGAEILVPGIRIPTYDAKAAAKDTLEVICTLRRRAIDLAYATSEGQTIIHGLTGGGAPDLPKMSCGQVRTLFRGAVTAKKVANNAIRTGDDRSGRSSSPAPIRTPAEHNKAMADYWAKKQ